MSKIIIRATGFVAVFTLLFALLAGAAEASPAAATGKAATSSTGGTGATAGKPGPAAASSTGETRAVVVGGLAFVLMVGAAGAVLWHTARGRHSAE